MTIAVDLGRKATKQTNKTKCINKIIDLVLHILHNQHRSNFDNMFNGGGNTYKNKEQHHKETNNMVCTPSEDSDQQKSRPNGTRPFAVHMKAF